MLNIDPRSTDELIQLAVAIVRTLFQEEAETPDFSLVTFP
jgi:hypothetical protein